LDLRKQSTGIILTDAGTQNDRNVEQKEKALGRISRSSDWNSNARNSKHLILSSLSVEPHREIWRITRGITNNLTRVAAKSETEKSETLNNRPAIQIELRGKSEIKRRTSHDIEPIGNDS
jgi:hypothetical protein